MLTPEETIGLDRSDTGAASRTIRVWVVEDKHYVREPLMKLLDHEDDLICERGFASAESMLEALKVSCSPDVILSDFSLCAMTGAESISHVAAIAPETRVVVMTSFWDSIKEMEAREAGAAGFIVKSQAPGDFAKAMRDAAALQSNPASRQKARMRFPSLSTREGAETRMRSSTLETESETRVVRDAIVVWVKRFMRPLGASAKSNAGRSGLNILRVSD